MTHTAEPWQLQNGSIYVRENVGIASMERDEPFTTPTERDANARRIAACVNACAGIPTEALEAGALARLTSDARDLAIHALAHAVPDTPLAQRTTAVAADLMELGASL